MSPPSEFDPFETGINDSSLSELASEARDVFNHVDSANKEIRDFEKNLTDLNAFFPFRQIVLEEQESPLKPPEARHKVYRTLGYRTRICWSFAWEEDDHSKGFRLFLISEEKEILLCQAENNKTCLEEFHSTRLSKKPLIATDLATRFKFYPYLNPFIIAFKEHLQRYLKSPN